MWRQKEASEMSTRRTKGSMTGEESKENKELWWR